MRFYLIISERTDCRNGRYGESSQFHEMRDTFSGMVDAHWEIGHVLMIQFACDSGCGLLEIFRNGPGIRTKGAIRHIAFSTDDVDGIISKVKDAGYDVFIEPNDLIIRSKPAFHARMAFCHGPLGEEIEFFQEKGSER